MAEDLGQSLHTYKVQLEQVMAGLEGTWRACELLRLICFCVLTYIHVHLRADLLGSLPPLSFLSCFFSFVFFTSVYDGVFLFTLADPGCSDPVITVQYRRPGMCWGVPQTDNARTRNQGNHGSPGYSLTW